MKGVVVQSKRRIGKFSSFACEFVELLVVDNCIWMKGLAVVGAFVDAKRRALYKVSACRIQSEEKTAISRSCNIDTAVVVWNVQRISSAPASAVIVRVGPVDIACTCAQ